MHRADPMTTPIGSRTRRSRWIVRVVAVAAVAAMTACASQEPASPAPTPTPVPGGEKTVIIHNVTISSLDPKVGTCTVAPTLLPGVGLGELVRFTNELSGQPVQLFDLPAELFGALTVTVPPSSSVSLQVTTQAQRGASYQYSVSCLPSTEARPRIVIRTSDSS